MPTGMPRRPTGAACAGAASFAALVLALVLSSPAPPARAAGARVAADKLDPRARAALAIAEARADPARRSTPLAARADAAIEADGSLDVFVTGAASRAELAAAGARVRTVLPGVCTASIPPAAVRRVAALARVSGIHGAVALEPLLELSVPTTLASLQRGPFPGFGGLDGSGVVIGLVDTGVDDDHEDLRDEDGRSRLVAAWDQTVFVGTPPPDYDYGAEWSRADFDGDLSTMRDHVGHGTHVLGIAAGDGSAGPVAGDRVGMAPRADLLVVKSFFQSTRIVDGIAWMFARAGTLGRPAVVNLSIGSHYGPHDGTSPLERALDALSGPGRLVVAACGNSRGRPEHAEAFAGADSARMQFVVSGARLGNYLAINGFYDAEDSLALYLRAPSGAEFGPLLPGEINAGYPGACGPDGCVYVENGATRTTRGDRWVYVEIAEDDGHSIDGPWTFRFVPLVLGPRAGEVDLWHYFQSSGSFFAGFGYGRDAYSELVTEPACAESVVAVAAHTTRRSWEDCAGYDNVSFPNSVAAPRLALFSSPGPTRDGRLKPEISAPGTAIASALTGDVEVLCPSGPSVLLPGLRHLMAEGTSMSAPHVAGALALLQQKRGPVSPAAAIAWLAENARHEPFMGLLPNPDWGHGGLVVGDLVDPEVALLAPVAGARVAVGDTLAMAWQSTDAYGGIATVALELARGDAWEPLAADLPGRGQLAWVVSGPAAASCRVRVVARDGGGNTAADTSAAFAIADAAEPPLALTSVIPNPSAGPVRIEFSLARGGPVTLDVLDVRGRRVARLLDRPLPSGRHEVTWSGTEAEAGAVRAGLVFVRLEAPGGERVRRIALVR